MSISSKLPLISDDVYDKYGISRPLHKLVFDYMVLFWKGVPSEKRLSKRALSKIIYEEHQDLFHDSETVRDIVRHITKSKGRRGRLQSERIDLDFAPSTNNPLGITEGFTYNQGQVFHLPEKYDKVLIISDLQIPFHDVAALNLALNQGLEEGINCVYINGDFIDWMGISRYETDPRLRKVKLEFYTARAVLEDIRRIIGPDIPIYFKIGNHDVRWQAYLSKNAPLIVGIAELEFSKLMKFKELGVHLVEEKTEARFGKLSVFHGHELSVYSSVNPARGFFNKFNGNILGSHHHRTSSHIAKTGRGEYHGAWSIGCLCLMKPDFQVVNQWNLGFAIVNWDKDEFEVKNYTIIEGTCRLA